MKKTLILMFVLVAFLGACKKDIVTPKAPSTTSEGKAFKDLKVQQSFDWKTTKNYTFTLTGYATNMVKIVSENNKTTYQSSLLKKDVDETFVVCIPSYEKSIRLKYMGQDILVSLNGNNVNYKFN